MQSGGNLAHILRRSLEPANSLPFAAPGTMVFPASVLSASDEAPAIAQELIAPSLMRSQGDTLARRTARTRTTPSSQDVFEQAMSDHAVLKGQAETESNRM